MIFLRSKYLKSVKIRVFGGFQLQFTQLVTQVAIFITPFQEPNLEVVGRYLQWST